VHAGALTHAVLDWMRERAGAPADTPTAEPPVAALANDLRLYARELVVAELPVDKEVGGEQRVKRLRARVSFELTGAGEYLASADSAGYMLQLLGGDPATGQATVLAGAGGQLRPELLAYTEELDFDVPPIGSYQLLANVVLPDTEAAAVALGPLLEVVV
jgi:hypothetical protein